MIEEPSHVKELSHDQVCKIGLKIQKFFFLLWEYEFAE